MHSYSADCSPWWDDSPLWIIGGGPSLKTFDLSLIHGRVLSVNGHALPVAACQSGGRCLESLFSLDHRWIRRNRDFIAGFEGEKFIALPLETWPDCGGIPGVTYLQWGHRDGWSEDPGIVNTGGNGGYAALNLAYLKRAKQVNLVGFDMAGGGEYKSQYPYWAKAFNTVLPQAKAAGVEVVNWSRESAIVAFPQAAGFTSV